MIKLHESRRFSRIADDRGGASLFVLISAVAVILAAGLVADGGLKLRAASEAVAVAEEAARAGAGQVDTDRLLADGGAWRIDPEQAVNAANAYLRDSGHNGSVSIINGGQTVRVSVTITRSTLILQSIGVGEVSSTKAAEADLVQGVNGIGK